MHMKTNIRKYTASKKAFAVLIISVLVCQFAACAYFNEPNDDDSTISNNVESTASIDTSSDTQSNIDTTTDDVSTNEISVIDKNFSFVNGRIYPEKSNTEFVFSPTLKKTDPKRIFYGAGTCSFLMNKKVVALFFIDDNSSSWDQGSIQQFTDKSVIPALEFLEKEALSWDVDLQFEIWRFSSALSKGVKLKYNGNVNPDLFDGGSTKDLLTQTANIFEYSCDMAFRWALEQKADGTEIIPIFILNKEGVSYARNNYIVSDVDAAEHAVVFSDNKYGSTDQAATFAHELLHLYGAEELYTPVQRYNLAIQLYEKDIMCLETRKIDKLKIEAFTAYTLGWNKKIPAICNDQDWYCDTYYQNYREWFN